jgi:hypothetical protein
VTKHETLTERERERKREKRKKGKKRASEPRRSAPSLFNLRNLEDKKKKEMDYFI